MRLPRDERGVSIASNPQIPYNTLSLSKQDKGCIRAVLKEKALAYKLKPKSFEENQSYV